MDAELKKVVIYTDGAAEPNPGPGGYGVVMMYGGHRRELCGGFRRTTNNRMELMGVIVALEALKAMCEVTLFSDSKYVVEAMTKGWAAAWREKEWLKKGVLMTNADLWKRLMELCEVHRVEFRWVKGHAGDVENERCDALSMMALAEQELPVDEGYEEEVAYAGGEKTGVGGSRVEQKVKDGEPVEGGPCRKCGGVLERRVPKRKGKGSFYYAFYLYCAGCGTNYMLEEAKRFD